ncbi:6-bladed beta-propeller [Algibacter pacificus]|uniref:6-bladed beta-propeller n=1 Tax=Algibacter pacificus TaxID=2599389 RepID=UPI0011CCA356|nr:6-bladed beta-propeller [Algibacter pacificus]
MKNITLVSIILLGLLIFVSCGNDFKSKKINMMAKYNIDIKDPSGKENEQSNRIGDYIDSCFYVKLQTGKNNYMGQIKKILIANDTIFIKDKNSKSIFIYTMEGKLIKKINDEGRGPNEYSSITDFTIDWTHNKLKIYDDRMRKQISYNYEGNFLSINKVKNYARNISYVGGEKFAFYNNYNGLVGDDNHNLRISDQSEKNIDRYFPYDKKLTSKTVRGKWDYFWTSNEVDVNMVKYYDNNIYRLEGSTIYPKYHFDFGQFNLPQDIILNSLNSGSNYVHSLSNLFESKNTLTVNYLFKNSNILLFYNKNTSNMVFPRSRNWVNETNFNQLFFPNYVLGCYKDYFIVAIPSDLIPSFIDRQEKILAPKDSNYFTNLEHVKDLKNINSMDNPVLFFYKMKDF